MNKLGIHCLYLFIFIFIRLCRQQSCPPLVGEVIELRPETNSSSKTFENVCTYNFLTTIFGISVKNASRILVEPASSPDPIELFFSSNFATSACNRSVLANNQFTVDT